MARAEAPAAIALVPFSDGQYKIPLFKQALICFTDKRVPFWTPNDDSVRAHVIREGQGRTGGSGSAFCYLGSNRDKFAAEFQQYGVIMVEYRR